VHELEVLHSTLRRCSYVQYIHPPHSACAITETMIAATAYSPGATRLRAPPVLPPPVADGDDDDGAVAVGLALDDVDATELSRDGHTGATSDVP
jgi:hypothetical protein